jgi:hypothetical protein
MAQSHAIQDQQAVQDPVVTALLAELQAIDEKARIVGRLYKTMDWISQNDTWYRNESIIASGSTRMRKEWGMIPGFIMWLLGVPLGVIILLFLFGVI